MADYKLSFTGQEIDEKLKKVEDGGTGYTEGETVHPIDPKFLPETPYFDLAAMGLPAVPMDGTLVFVDTDSTKIKAALDSGAAKFRLLANMGGEIEIFPVLTGVYVPAMGAYQANGVFSGAGGALYVVSIAFGADAITAAIYQLS